MSKRKIAYVMSRFPFLPETFILREMNEMEAQGWEIALFPLINQQEAVTHSEAIKWNERAYRKTLFSGEVLADFVKGFLKEPGKVAAIWWTILVENLLDPNFLIKSLAFFPKSVHLARKMQAQGIDHIHAHYATYPALAAWIIHRLTGISYSVTVHAHDIFESKAMLGVKLKEAEFIAAISDFNRRYLIDWLGEWVSEKIHVVRCGIRPESYPTIQSEAVDGTWHVIHIGSLQPYKGQRILVETCRILKEKNCPIRVQVVGAGEERRNLEDLIHHYGLEDQVKLLGARTQEEIAALLPAGMCYAQPSIILPRGTMEGIPVALMEAMACGLPVVATGISGIPELVRDGETGLLVPPGDAGALADAFTWIFEHYDQAREMGQAGRRKVLADFDLHKNAAVLGKYFEEILQ